MKRLYTITQPCVKSQGSLRRITDGVADLGGGEKDLMKVEKRRLRKKAPRGRWGKLVRFSERGKLGLKGGVDSCSKREGDSSLEGRGGTI